MYATRFRQPNIDWVINFNQHIGIPIMQRKIWALIWFRFNIHLKMKYLPFYCNPCFVSPLDTKLLPKWLDACIFFYIHINNPSSAACVFECMDQVMPLYTPGTLMTSAAADVINHNGRKIGRFKHIRFCYAMMTSAQSWSRRHHWFEPTPSLPIFKGLYLVIFETLALIFPVQLNEC